MGGKRDNAYYLKRLETEYPAICAQLRAGTISSVRQAAAAAGLIHLPKQLNVLKRAWRKASPDEQRQFRAWIGAHASLPAIAPAGILPAAGLPTSITDADGFLTDETIQHILDIKAKGVKPGHIMTAMGYKSLSPRLGFFLRKAGRPSRDFITRLTRWLDSQK